jgi:phosphopantothenoylcysteine decarboxylase/phosphopantothenate--cysteine ligase
MGFALAHAAWQAQGRVVLISGPVSLPTPPGVERIDVVTSDEMAEAVLQRLSDADVVIKAAAVADYKPEVVYEHKIKKDAAVLTLRLQRTVDIAKEIGNRKRQEQFFVGFAAETTDLAKHAQTKLRDKNMDLIVANEASYPDKAFGADINTVRVYDKEGEVLALNRLSKAVIAQRLIQLIGERLYGRVC